MKLSITHRYLLLPVRNGADKVILRLQAEGETLREFDLELAIDGEPDWWAFYDVAAFRGAELDLVAPDLADESPLARLTLSDEVPDADSLYREALRPQLHFTPRRGWNNDPNGLAWLAGEWHLFFQHNPFGIGWGNMHWGHAVSSDLLHWEELPIALYPRGLGDMAYSGGAVVDEKNSAGFGAGALIASFTSTGRGECLAASGDRGRTFIDWAGNPILAHKGRDPKIVRHAASNQWVMIVYDETDGDRRYALHGSKDLKRWRHLSDIVAPGEQAGDGWYECPEFFPLPYEGETRWVVHGAILREAGGKRHITRSSYQVGRFDGTTFEPETPVLDGHLGPHFYAAQTFSHSPDGRRILMGWLAGASYPGMPFSQGMTLPLALTLRSTPAGPRLGFQPVAELARLRTATHAGDGLNLAAANALLAPIDAELLDIELDLRPGDRAATLHVHGSAITWRDGHVDFGGVAAPVDLSSGLLRLRVIVDRGVVEVFADDGRVALAQGGLADQTRELHLDAGADVEVVRLWVHELEGVWG